MVVGVSGGSERRSAQTPDWSRNCHCPPWWGRCHWVVVEGLGVTCRRGEAVPRKLSRKAVSCCLGGGHCTTEQKKTCVFFLNWVAS